MQFLKKVFDFYVAEVCIFFVPFFNLILSLNFGP
ncbi:hypothetical protein PhiCPG1p7 [Chlamydia phage CPG1]|nr:hypothetical protein PhiCPG1p7 [Chlamydia phage CPG1]